jgi:hypothetical protein
MEKRPRIDVAQRPKTELVKQYSDEVRDKQIVDHALVRWI